MEIGKSVTCGRCYLYPLSLIGGSFKKWYL